jgi:hypothetical protein
MLPRLGKLDRLASVMPCLRARLSSFFMNLASMSATSFVARGITRKTAIRITQQHGWQRRRGNDGTARVFIRHSRPGPIG